MTDDGDRKRRGAWYTPAHLVEAVINAVIDDGFVESRAGRPIVVLDPSCGDGRFLAAAGAAIDARGARPELIGVDLDGDAVGELAARRPDVDARCADALHSAALEQLDGSVDLVVGNPPFLSQLAAETTRGGSSRHGGGPYADAAAEFLALGARLVRPDGGRLAYVLPQSILSSRDAGPVRTVIDAAARMMWSTWTGQHEFDADVVTCALAFEFGTPTDAVHRGSWSHVITSRTGVPALPSVFADSAPASGRLGDRAWINANFRDEYYGMIPAVGDHCGGPRLVTSGLIDPGRLRWGERPVRFAKRSFLAPRFDLAELDESMRRWAVKRSVPKVLVANQTSIVEAVCDPDGDCLPGVPVVGIYPSLGRASGLDDDAIAQLCWEIAAVLCSPAVSVWAWHRRGGTGLSPDAIRVGPTMLAELPWPSGDLAAAVAALRSGDIAQCGGLVDRAYGITSDEADRCLHWWRPLFERVSARP